MSRDSKAMVTSNAVKAYIIFQTTRQITSLYKSHLALIHDIYKEQEIMKKKLENYVPKEVLDNVDHLSADKYNYIRKKTLDIGNEAIREFEAKMERVEINIKNKKES